MTELYEKAEDYVKEVYKGKHGIPHFVRTVYWVKQLRPEADEALLIAAIGHDIERGFRTEGSEQMKRLKEQGMTGNEFLTYHQETGAKIMKEFLEKEGANKAIVQRVVHLISKHEVGGDEDQNLLKDADSISFFENNVEHFLTYHVQKIGKQKVKDKFEWMFNRITSFKAKKIARPWYEEGIKGLNNNL